MPNKNIKQVLKTVSESLKQYIDDQLKNYAKTSDIPTKVSQLLNDSAYLKSVPPEYVTESELTAKNYLTSVPSEYITDSELTAKGYATQSYVDGAIDGIDVTGQLSALTLGLHTDGLVYLFMNGKPLGTGIAMIGGDTGDVIGNIDSSNNIILYGSLSEGAYKVQYEMENGTLVDVGTLNINVNGGTDTPVEPDEPEQPTIINQIPISINADGGLFVGTNGEKGYKTGYRISGSSGSESSQTGTEVTGFIPVASGDTVYIKNIIDDGSHVTGLYNESYAKVNSNTNRYICTMDGSVQSFKIEYNYFTSEGTSFDFSTVKYMRISASEITNESIVTVNQEIVE